MTEPPESREVDARAPDLRARVVANTTAQLASPGLRAVVGVFLFAILGRYLGVAGFGEYGLVVAWVILFTNALGDWGLATILVREISRSPAQRGALIASAALLQLLLGALCYVAILAIALVSGYADEVRVSLALFGLTLFLAPVQMLTAHFATDLRLTRLVAPGIVGTLAQLVLTLAAVALGAPLSAIVAANTVSVFVELGWSALLVLRELPLDRPSPAPWRLFIGEAWPLAIVTLLTAGARQAPVLVLTSVGLDAVGIYSAATKIPDYLSRIPLAFRTTMFPLLARRWHERSGFGDLVRLTILATLVFTVPIALVAAGFSRRIVTLVFGDAFGNAGVPFAILMAAFVFLSLGVLLEAALVAMGRQRLDLLVRIVTSLILVAVLVTLAGTQGASGSAIAVLASATAAAVLTLFAIARGPRRAVPT